MAAEASLADELSAEYNLGEEEAIPDDEEPEDTSEYRYQEHKRNFYNMYRPHYERASNTHLIDDVMYSEILEVCLRAPGSKFDNRERGYRRKYQVQGNIQRRVLYRGDLAVTTYEQVFDVILEAHNKISHARDVRKNKKCINEDLGYYGVPEQAVQCFIDTCPTVSVVLFHIFCELRSATLCTNLNSKLP